MIIPWQLYAFLAMLSVAVENNITRLYPLSFRLFVLMVLFLGIPQIYLFWMSMQGAPKLISAWYFYMSISVIMSLVSTVFIVKEAPGAVRWLGVAFVLVGARLLR